MKNLIFVQNCQRWQICFTRIVKWSDFLKTFFPPLIVRFSEIFKVGKIRKNDEERNYFEKKTLSSFIFLKGILAKMVRKEICWWYPVVLIQLRELKRKTWDSGKPKTWISLKYSLTANAEQKVRFYKYSC